MLERDLCSGRRRVQEESYFRRVDQALLERLRRGVDPEAERRLMAQAIGLDADGVVLDLQLVGYTSDTVVLLELAPAVQVAWADGGVSLEESECLWQLAAREHVVRDSIAHDRFEEWLRRRPSAVLTASLRALRHIVRSLPPDAQAFFRRKLINDCAAVAAASGGAPGWRRVSDERREIERIADELAPDPV